MCRAYPSSRGLKHRRARAPKDPSPVVIGYARLQHAATAGARAAVTLPFERLAQRSFPQIEADLDVLAASQSPFPGRSAWNPPGKAGGSGERIVFVRMTFTQSDPDSLEAVRALYYRDEIRGVLARQKGHRFHHLLESVDVPGESISVTAWDSREDAEAYENSDAYENLVAKFRNFYTGPERLASYEVRE
jgi:heme-degrading monooxygenase HmoA